MGKTRIAEVVESSDLVDQWLSAQREANVRRQDLVDEKELRDQAWAFLRNFGRAAATAGLDVEAEAWDEVRQLLRQLSYARAEQGFSPGETSLFVLTLKNPLMQALSQIYRDDRQALLDDIWRLTLLLDKLGIYVTEIHLQAKEAIIARQQDELLELSTPVVELWDDILALPLIGTLDSRRAEIMMERLLEEIARTQSEYAIVDVTGVPTVDTLTAQHLLKTIAAVRLMGAEVVISGLRPAIAQTMVSIGIELGDVISRPSLAAALRYVFKKRGILPESLRGGAR